MAGRGRPKGSKNRKTLQGIKYDEKTVERLKSINASDDDIYRFEHPFQCSCCGRRFTKQQGNFPFSQSPIYNGNNHYLTICYDCIDKLLEQYVSILGSQKEAIKRICMKIDMYYDEKFLSSQNNKFDSSLLKTYIRQANLLQNANKTYDTYLAESSVELLETFEDVQNLASDGERITKSMFDRWQGFDKDDMIFLEEHYKMLKKQNPNVDSNGEIFIRDLCTTKLLQTRAIKNSDIGAYDKLTKLYSDTFAKAGLRTLQEEDKSNENPFGVTLEIISQYTPEEFYKDKKLYKDYDGIGELLERHVYRPLRNLECNEHVQDPEFNVGDDNETD